MAILILVILGALGGGIYWLDNTEDSCWKHEAAHAFEHYKMLNTRSAVLRAAENRGLEVRDSGLNLVEVVESDPNGCSLGSNGQTVVRFYFDDANKLTMMRVFRNYLTARNYQMELVEERDF
jgi:hypothetical protein